jgi:acetate kinase
MYALPQRLYKQHQVRRYGFHGTSHKYVSDVAAQVVGKDLKDLKVVTCHIGNGGSLTAIKDGKSFDTSMGMTPLEGLMMGTRSGDMDPAIVPYVMAKEDLTINEVNSMLNKHSGLLAISGLSSDMREITDTMHENENAKLAFDMYVYRVKKYIGSYAAAMNGLDVLVFTAGVGENSIVIRQAVCEGLTFFGIEIDEELNKIRSKDPRVISKEGSKVKVLVIPTNEELIIARDTFNIINNKA